MMSVGKSGSDPGDVRSDRSVRETRQRSRAASAARKSKGAQAGRAASPLPFPAARENTGKKIFWGALGAEKPLAIIDLDTTLGKNRGLGREPAGKPENCPIAG